MRHGGGVRVVVSGSATSRAGSEHPLPSASASHTPRHPFGPTWCWTPNGGDWLQHRARDWLVPERNTSDAGSPAARLP